MPRLAESVTDWVMIGYRQGEQHVVIASNTLTRVDLEAHYHQEYGFAWDGAICSRGAELSHITINGVVNTYVMAVGATYGEALRRIMEMWQPSESVSSQPEVGSGH